VCVCVRERPGVASLAAAWVRVSACISHNSVLFEIQAEAEAFILIDSGLVGRKVLFIHHIRPLMSGVI